MMADEYIKRDTAYNYLTEYYNHRTDNQHQNLRKALNAIPSADVAEVRHGKWIRPTRVPDSMLDECSICGFDTGAFTFNYCPNCGARMDGE